MKRVTAVFFMVVFVSLFFFSEEAEKESLCGRMKDGFLTPILIIEPPGWGIP